MDQHNQVDAQLPPSPTTSKASVKGTQGKETSPFNRRLKGGVYISEEVEARTHWGVSLVGYSLLAFSLLDYLYIIIPLQLTNPAWEFQTIGALVEHVAVPLLALAMVFYRRLGYIGELERKFLGGLSWVSLLLGLLYLLMLPLGVADTWRLYNANKAEVSAQISQQNQPLQQLKVKLNQAKTAEQLKQLLSSLNPQAPIPQIGSPQALKDELLGQISQSQQKIQAQVHAVGATRRRALLKDSVKWNVGALVAGVLFIWIWRLNRWVRVRKY